MNPPLKKTLTDTHLSIPYPSPNKASDAGEKLNISSVGDLKVIVLEGSPYERGLTHGRLLKKEILEVIGKWKAQLAAGYKVDPDEFIPRFISQTNFLPAIEKWTPGLLDEVKGMAEGAGVTFESMLFFQLPDEEWTYAASIAANHCTSMGIARQGERPAMIAQNMDINGFYNGYQTLLCIQHPLTGLESFVFTCAGLIGLNGVNNRGLGIVVNTLSQLSPARDGLPVSFTIRGLLEQKTPDEAIHFLYSIKHASGQNYIIGGLEKSSCFECSANKVSPFIPIQDMPIVYHTNHPLSNDDYCEEFRAWLATHDMGEIRDSNSVTRFESMEKRIKGNLTALDMDDFQSVLRSSDSQQHPICAPYIGAGETFTFGSIIMILSEKPEIWITPGPPDLKEYLGFTFPTSIKETQA
jgi:isopenicillin-N N-acyltransferase like protein